MAGNLLTHPYIHGLLPILLERKKKIFEVVEKHLYSYLLIVLHL
jgi:hypothetical protein